MTHADLQLRAVQSLVKRADEFRSNLLNQPCGSEGMYHYTHSLGYGSWELIKLFADSPRVAAEVRTMENISSYMSGHREHSFYCQVELWTALNSLLDMLAQQRFLPTDIYGSTEACLANVLKTLGLTTATLSRNHVDYEYARFLLLHSARLLRETTATLTDASEALGKRIELALVPMAAAIVALESNSDKAAVAACENAHAVTALLQKAAA